MQVDLPRQIACQRCRRRKKKCDHKRPICGECRRTNSECVQASPVRSAADSAVKHIRSLERHITSLEEYIIELEEAAKLSNPSAVRDHLSPGNLRQSQHQAPLGNTTGHLHLIQDETNYVLESPGSPHSQCLSLPASPERTVGTDARTPEFSHQNVSVHPVPNDSLFRDFDFQSNVGLGVYHNIYSSEATRRLEGMYSDVYFKDVQCSWPFLHERRWRHWASEHDSGLTPRGRNWQVFFIDMVRSVGALVSQKFDRASEHRDRSDVGDLEALYTEVILAKVQQFYCNRARKSLSLMLGQPSRILHTQSSLLLTMHAIHSESPDAIDDQASKSMMHCAVAGLYQHRFSSSNEARSQKFEDDEGFMERQVMRVCYGLDRLIATAFDRPVSVPDELINVEKLGGSVNSNLAHCPPNIPPIEFTGTGSVPEIDITDHRFRLRQIQSKIHSTVERLEYHAVCQNKLVTNLWISDLRFELDRWKEDLAHIQIASMTSFRWLSNLYYYNILALFPNMSLAVQGDDVYHVAQAASEVLRNFRFIQIPEQKACYTWTALTHQFQAGITLLYCFWAAPRHVVLEIQSWPDTNIAFLACSATLSEFALRWNNAKAFKVVFDTLYDRIIRAHRRFGDSNWTYDSEIQGLIDHLRKARTQRRLLALVEEMSGAAEL